MSDKITTRARELADAALPVNFDGNLSLRAPEEGDVRLGVHNRDRDPLLISLATVIEAAMREVKADFDEGVAKGAADERRRIEHLLRTMVEAATADIHVALNTVEQLRARRVVAEATLDMVVGGAKSEGGRRSDPSPA